MLRKLIPFAFAILLLTGCTATYQRPETFFDKSAYSKVVNLTFDETWQRLIEYAAASFFAIENYEKESGLMILSFGSIQPSQFVDGGFWKSSGLGTKFEGNYVDYLAQHRGGSLNSKMKIVVIELAEDKTRVTVNAHYIFTCPPDTWVFDSGGSATVKIESKVSGTPDTRTLVPTHIAEQSILDALESEG